MKYGTLHDFEVDKKLGVVEYTERLDEIRTKRDKHFDDYGKKSIEKGKIECKYDLDIGDSVAIFKNNPTNKFTQTWFPGFTVVSKIPPDAYVVSNGKKNFRVNKKHVKRFPILAKGVS